MSQDTRPLAEQIAEQLVAYIIEHDLHNGDRLPPEADLVAPLNVGRSALREAIRMLVSRNILEVRRGAGTFVCENTGITSDPLGFAFIRDKRRLMSDLIDFRMMIEPHIAALAAQNATEEDADTLSALADAMEAKYAQGGSHHAEDAAFHSKLGEISGNVIMPTLEPIIFSAIELFIDMTHSRLREETIRSHRAIVDAVRAHDPVAAHDAMFLHLAHNRDRLRRENHSEEAQP